MKTSSLLTALRWFLIPFFLLSNLLTAQEDTSRSYPLGPVGGEFRLVAGERYVRVSKLTPMAPGAKAGLKVNDLITGYNDQYFSPTGLDRETDFFKGAVRELGAAIEFAESTDGRLNLMVIRPGVGLIHLTVNLPPVGFSSPAWPLNTPKTQHSYDVASLEFHRRIMAGGARDYYTPWGGLALLGNPHWNETSGDTPFRLSIDLIRDRCVSILTRAEYAPVEPYYYDGSPNPHYVECGLENWDLGPCAMFVAEYYAKTKDPAFLPIVQMAAEKLANRVQWIRQSPTQLNIGRFGHGGVDGDYGNNTINVLGVHILGGLVFCKMAGADMTVAPNDSRYFGFDPNTPESELPNGVFCYDENGNKMSIVPPGFENRQPTLDEKIQFAWTGLKNSMNMNCGSISYVQMNWEGPYDGYVRSVGALFGGLHMLGKDQHYTDDDLTHIQAGLGFVNNYHDMMLKSHASVAPGVYFANLLAPDIQTRNRRHWLENWRFYWTMQRSPNDGFSYFINRNSQDPYGDTYNYTLIHAMLPLSVARGGLTLLSGYSSQPDLLVDFSKVPHAKWDKLEYRELMVSASPVALDLNVTDQSGVPTSHFSAEWITDDPNLVIHPKNALDTTITATTPGSHQATLRVTSPDGSIVTEEPIRFNRNADTPDGYRPGLAVYQRYNEVPGVQVDDLTNSPKFPAAPDQTLMISRLENPSGGGNHGDSVTTCIIPPVTGSYQFFVAADDTIDLFFNPNGPDAEGAVKIAYTRDWTNPYQWNKFPTQTSTSFELVAGQPYYLHAIHKQASGGNHFAIAWTTPNSSTPTVIDAFSIALPPLPSPHILEHPQSVSGDLGESLTLKIVTSIPAPAIYQWRHNGRNFGIPQATPELVLANPGAAIAGTWDCVYTYGNYTEVSQPATVSFHGLGTPIPHGLWQEIYHNIQGSSIAELTRNVNFPLFPSSSNSLGVPESANIGELYGERWTGWFIPASSGKYRFYTCASTSAQLSLSPDEFESHKKLIDSCSHSTNQKIWSENPPSQWIELQAGKKYFIEFLHKENSNAYNHAEFTWQKENDAEPRDSYHDNPNGDVLTSIVGGIAPDATTAPPTVNDDHLLCQPGRENIIQVLANDADADHDRLRITHISQPSSGHVVPSPDRHYLIYTSPTNGAVATSFTYEVTNAIGKSATATVTIEVAQPTTGGLWQQVYKNVSGTQISDLIANPAFPQFPTEEKLLTTTATKDFGDNYGQRWSGWFIPPTTGNYRFFIAADDSAQLFLSPDAYESHKKLLVSSTSYVADKRWSDRQPSAWQHLLAGQRYYIEFLHKEAGGGGDAAFTWQIEGEPNPVNGELRADPSALQYIHGGTFPDAETTPPLALADEFYLPAGNQVSISPLDNDADASPESLTITSFTQPATGSVELSPDGHNLIFSSDVTTIGSTQIQYTVTNRMGHSASAQITLHASGGLWQDMYRNISTPRLDELLKSEKFPYQPDDSHFITHSNSSNLGDFYGEAWTGWVIPPTSGFYRFYLTSDDASQLFLSPDALPSHAVSLLNRNNTIAAQSWSSAQPSAYLYLQAGQPYYLKALHKEAGGADHIHLTWQKEGDPNPTNGEGEIPADCLRCQLHGVYHDEDVALFPTTTPYIRELSTNYGTPTPNQSVTIHGSNLTSIQDVKLIAADQSEIHASSIQSIDEESLTATFDLSNQPLGPRTLVVTNDHLQSTAAFARYQISPPPPSITTHRFVNPDEPISVSFSNTSGNTRDWLGLYEANSTPGSSNPAHAWTYMPNSNSGTINLNGYREPGDYKVCLLENDGYTVLAETLITIKPLTAEFAETSTTIDHEAGTLTTTLHLSRPYHADLAIPFTTSGTATQGSDYTIDASPIIIPAGQTSATLTTHIIPDSRHENDELIEIHLGTMPYGSLGAVRSHHILIPNDDEAPANPLPSLWWKLDEADGNLAHDSSGNLADATVTGTPLWHPNDGISGGALAFNGTDSQVNFPFTSLQGQPYTVSFWVKSLADGQHPSSAAFSSSATNTPNSFQIDLGQGYRYAGTASASFGPAIVNQWTHLTVVCDGSTTALYYNGALTTTLPCADTNFTAAILGRNRNSQRFFNGLIDDVQIFPAALNPTQVDLLFNGAYPSTPPAPPSSSAASTPTPEPKSFHAWTTEILHAAKDATPEQLAQSDDDHDGRPALLEYALNSSPATPDVQEPQHVDKHGLWFETTRPQGGRDDIEYVAEASEDMIHWHPAILEVVAPGNPETIRVRDPLTSGDLSHRFIRLSVRKK